MRREISNVDNPHYQGTIGCVPCICYRSSSPTTKRTTTKNNLNKKIFYLLYKVITQ